MIVPAAQVADNSQGIVILLPPAGVIIASLAHCPPSAAIMVIGLVEGGVTNPTAALPAPHVLITVATAATVTIVAILIAPTTTIIAIAIAPPTVFAVADAVADAVVDMATAATVTTMATIIPSAGRCPPPWQLWPSVAKITCRNSRDRDCPDHH